MTPEPIHPDKLYGTREVAPLIGYASAKSIAHAWERGTCKVPFVKGENGRLMIRGANLRRYLERRG